MVILVVGCGNGQHLRGHQDFKQVYSARSEEKNIARFESQK